MLDILCHAEAGKTQVPNLLVAACLERSYVSGGWADDHMQSSPHASRGLLCLCAVAFMWAVGTCICHSHKRSCACLHAPTCPLTRNYLLFPPPGHRARKVADCGGNGFSGELLTWVWNVMKNADKTCSAVMHSTSSSAMMTMHVKNQVVQNMEKMLSLYIK